MRRGRESGARSGGRPGGRVLAGLAVLALLGCSDRGRGAAAAGPEGASQPPSAAGFPLSIEDPQGRALRIERPPRRVMVANAGAADLVLALVGPERVAAVPQLTLAYSKGLRTRGPWPEEKLFERYVGEEVLAARPDLLVDHVWQDKAVARVARGAGVPVLTLPELRSLEDLLGTIELLGRVLGEDARAAELVAELRARVAAMQPQEGAARPSVLSYSNYGSGGFTAGTDTTYDLVFRLAGLRNAAAEAGIHGIAPIDAERLLTIDPDWILVGTSVDAPGTSPSADALRTEPGLRELGAVRAGRIVQLPAELYASVSQYLVEAAERLRAAID